MNANSAVLHKEKPTFLVEVTNIEKLLWALIHSKGLLHPDVRDLYNKAGSTYEKIFLSNLKHEELQEVEYSLWKLHYKHIDEFRKMIKPNSANSEGKSSVIAESERTSDRLVKEFKSFLSRATEFYRSLILKIRRYYGVSKEVSLRKGTGIATSVERKEIQKCKFICHRFFVCLGDLARYWEQYLKMGDEKHNWSTAATHYLEATNTWPDSGNPHNQLAVLATYVGDEFLALYHCVRSLAVKEPFPDAWSNLILLFEKNRSYHLPSLYFDVQFDFSKPSQRSSEEITSKVENDFTSAKLWPLVVRTMSFFFLKSSLDDFVHVFASTMRELDAMLRAYDGDLKPMLECYQLMDSERTGPFRTLQLVAIYIFIFHNLTVVSKTKGSSEDNTVKQQVALKHLGLATAFIIMGRLVERCLNTNPPSSCPLLPAILVFVEYLPLVLNEEEECGFDDKSASAMLYFFGAFAILLNRLNVKKSEYSFPERTALWEDRELRGFAPVSPSHTSLDFSTYQDHGDNCESGIESRVKRIINAALKIANRPKGSQKWIFFDKPGSRFYTAESNVTADMTKQVPDENGKSVATEEEEVILFKPLIRYNSAPLQPCVDNTTKLGSPKSMEDQTVPSDECLRRATSALTAQNPVDCDASDISNFRFNIASKQPGSSSKDSFSEGPILAGPPSLSAWVINSDSEKGRRDIKHRLSPIDEITPVSFSSLSIGETETEPSITSNYCSTHESADSAHSLYSASTCSQPIQSAPLVPEDASWFHCTDKAENFNGASENIGSRDHGLLNYGLPLQDFMNRYPNLPFRGISSSEWLRLYLENHQSLEPDNYTHAYPAQANLTSRFGLLDRYGTPTEPANYTENSRFYHGFGHFYVGDERKGEKLLHGYQRTNPL